MKSKLNFFFLCWRKKRLFLMEWRGCRSNKRNKFLLIYAFASRLWLIRPTSPTKQLFSSSFILSLMGCFCLLVLNEERARLLKWSWMEFNEAEWSRGRGAAAHNPANLKKTSSPPQEKKSNSNQFNQFFLFELVNWWIAVFLFLCGLPRYRLGLHLCCCFRFVDSIHFINKLICSFINSRPTTLRSLSLSVWLNSWIGFLSLFASFWRSHWRCCAHNPPMKPKTNQSNHPIKHQWNSSSINHQ